MIEISWAFKPNVMFIVVNTTHKSNKKSAFSILYLMMFYDF